MNSLTDATEDCSKCGFSDNLDMLRHIEFFSKLPMEVLKVFAYLSVKENFMPGDYLFQQNEDDGQAFYILSGTTQLIRESDQGDKIMGEYGEKRFIGGLSLLGNMQRLFSLKAVTPVVCLMMTRDKFRSAIANFPELRPKIKQAMINRIVDWEKQSLGQMARGEGPPSIRVGASLL